MYRTSSVAAIVGIASVLVTACGSTTGPGLESTLAPACDSTLAAYCSSHADCRESAAAWSKASPTNARARSGPDGSCNGLTYFTDAISIDQSNDYYYDSSGKLVAVGGWESAEPCSGSCRYVCAAGPRGFDPCAVPADKRQN